MQCWPLQPQDVETHVQGQLEASIQGAGSEISRLSQLSVWGAGTGSQGREAGEGAYESSELTRPSETPAVLPCGAQGSRSSIAQRVTSEASACLQQNNTIPSATQAFRFS